VCETGRCAEVASWCVHRGEEPCISGPMGSGTVFFAHCNLACAFCQNYQISQEWRQGEGVKSAEELAEIYLELQSAGVHNLNWVSPSHVVPQALEALAIAARSGLRLPVVYNSGGYDSVETLRLLDGIFDIYMPDLKFMERDVSQKLCGADDYPERVMEGIREMHRQVGDLKINRMGIAERGLLVRHLVMPGGLAGTRKAMRFLSQEISPNTYVNIMAQFRPCGRAKDYPPLNRRITDDEFEEAIRMAEGEGIHRLGQRTGWRAFRFL